MTRRGFVQLLAAAFGATAVPVIASINSPQGTAVEDKPLDPVTDAVTVELGTMEQGKFISLASRRVMNISVTDGVVRGDSVVFDNLSSAGLVGRTVVTHIKINIAIPYFGCVSTIIESINGLPCVPNGGDVTLVWDSDIYR